MQEKQMQAIRSILTHELRPAMGCTEPIAVAYTAALARNLLGTMPKHMIVRCSGNIVKNVKGVTVPNSGGQKGIDTAAIMGMLSGRSDMELEVLSGCPVDTKENIVLACDIVRGKGVRRVFVSLGRDGMYYRGPEGGIWGVSRPFDGMVNATGAGDASMAGIIYATRQGYAADEILAFGTGAGMVAIASSDTISREMSPAAIETMVKEYIK